MLLLLLNFYSVWWLLKAAFCSLDAFSKMTLHKLDLNFLYWAGSCFVALFSYEGKQITKKQLQVDQRIDATSIACYLLDTSSDKD